MHFNDSAVDWATLPDFGFIAEHLDETYYNQLSGKSMKAYFMDKELRQLDVNGNVLVLTYPMENDSTYNKLINAIGSYLVVKLKPKQQMDKMVLWPDVSGRAVPLFLAKKSDLFLEGFKWYENLRPDTPESIFGCKDEMDALMQEEIKTSRRKRKAN